MLERQEQETYRTMMAEKTRASSGKDTAANKSKGADRWLGHTSKRMIASFFLFQFVLWGGTLGFWHLEPGLSFFDALYLCVVTVSPTHTHNHIASFACMHACLLVCMRLRMRICSHCLSLSLSRSVFAFCFLPPFLLPCLSLLLVVCVRTSDVDSGLR